MEKSRLRSLIWVLLTALSLACYVYLHVASVQEIESNPSASSSIRQEEDDSQKDSKILFPDIALMKQILNITKVVLPKD